MKAPSSVANIEHGLLVAAAHVATQTPEGAHFQTGGLV